MNIIHTFHLGEFGRFRRANALSPSIAAMALAIAYSGGLWLHLLHEWRGVHEQAAVPPVLHWLRDSTLALPVIILAVWLGVLAWRRLNQRLGRAASRMALAAGLALSATLAFAAGVPVHGYLFGAEHVQAHVHAGEAAQAIPPTLADQLLSQLTHALSDGLQVLPVNLAIAALMTLLLGVKAFEEEPGRAALRVSGSSLRLRAGRAMSALMNTRRWATWLEQPVVVVQPKTALRPWASGIKWPGRLAHSLVSVMTLFAILLAPLQGVAMVSAAPGQAAPACRAISADVVALDQTIVYNRLGAVDPEGMIFALRQDVVDKATGLSEAEGGTLTSGNVQLRSDKRPRPLTLRMNVGDCLTINFQNLLGPAVPGQIQTRNAGISVLGMQLKNSILDDGSNVGQNAATTGTAMAGLVAPDGTATYTFYAEREGAYQLYSPSDTVGAEGTGVLAHGLFGAINVEPTGAEWYRSQVTRDDMDLATTGQTGDGHPIINYDAVYPEGHRFAGKPILKMLDGSNKIVHSDLTAIITGPGRGSFIGSINGGWYPPNPTYPNRNQPFREFTIVFHDEAAMVQAFQVFSDPAFQFMLHGVRDGKAINYGTGGIAAEVLANRFGVGPTANCPECKLEEFFLTSWALGDPAQIVDVPANTGCGADCTGAQGPKATQALYPDDPSNVYHSYINDHTKIRNIHVGKEHHIFHLHSHQWLQTPDDDNSSYLDSQAIGPGSSYTYEIAFGGSGNRNKTPGDAIFHCHFYPHFAQGMWGLWRVNDVFQRGTQLDATTGQPMWGALPDGEIAAGTPTPAVIPIPGLPMAPMPGVEAQIVNGQVDLAGFDLEGNPTTIPDGTPDYLQGWPAPAGNPGYPFYIPGVAGHRPPTPVLDMTDPVTGAVVDGGLPRHVIAGGTAVATTTNLDLSKVVETATAVYPPEAGTPAEVQAMAFHAQLRHDTYKPDGTQATGASGFETNGLPPVPGAPYAEPCRKDDGTFNSAAPLRTYKGADLQLDMKLNKLGWHFPQARMLALWQDVGPLLSGQAAPQPFVMRANSGDCINYYHTNLVPGNYEQDAYQVRTPTDIIGQHIHLVKFDVTSSDGSGNGFNYEDGTFSPDEVRERIAAIREHNQCDVNGIDGAPGDTICPVAAAHPFFGPGPNGAWLGARTTIQRWWADPIVNNAGLDRTLGNVYTHDHYGPSTHQQTGLYATLMIEPSKSLWRDAETGNCYGDTSLVGRPIPSTVLQGGCKPVARMDGGPTSWRADILTADNAGIATANYDKESFREFYFEFSDFQHAYAADKGATFANHDITINGTTYTVQVATIIPDPLYAINPPGAIQNQAVSAAQPWLRVKPTLEGQGNVCPDGSPLAFTDRGCPETISTADIGTFSMNYRNEPVAARVLDPATMQQAAGPAGDLSLAFKSSDPTCKADDDERLPKGAPIPGCVPFLRADPRLNVQPTFYPPLTADVQPGDPYTPMMRAYEGDRIRIKLQVGATEEGHNASLAGAKWLQEFASPNSGWRNSQMMGISEQFNWDDTVGVDPLEKGNRTDYLFTPDSAVDGAWNGMWGLLRSYSKYRAVRKDLLALPNNRIDVKGQNEVANLINFDQQTGYMCPTNAPKVTFNVTAVLARDVLPGGTLIYNSRTVNGGPLHDPTAILYVRSVDLDASGKLKAGVPIEPLILRAKAGDCIKLVLRNKLPAVMPDLPGYNMLPPIIDRFTINELAPKDTFNANDLRPSNRVGLRPQLVAYEASRGSGTSIGRNNNKTVGPGEQKHYWWYAGDLSFNVKTGNMKATPVEFGATNLISSDPIKHSNKGAIGALVIEPRGAQIKWVEDLDSRASATVYKDANNNNKVDAGEALFRDFVLLFQDDLNLRFGLGGLTDGGPVPFVAGQDDAEDSGMKALNYRTEPLWFRLGIPPTEAEGNISAYDFTNAVANGLIGGDPQTPIFKAIAGQAIRLRVLQPNGHARNHVFTLHGHVWQRNPYINNSTQIGNNGMSQWMGSQEGHGPTDHWDIVPQNGAGGAFKVTGDYLYRDMAPLHFYNGLWGILRVNP